jgi:ribosome recycling factor
MDINESKTKLAESVVWLQKEFSAIRSGQASPALLDGISVESYGVHMPMNQVSTVGVEDVRTLRISPFDSSQISAIEQAIQEANLGVSLASDSGGVRVIFPELTADRRTQLQKLAKAKLEDSRIAVRAIRDEVMKLIEKNEKAGDISEDQKYDQKEQLQKAVEETNGTLEGLYTKKESELAA